MIAVCLLLALNIPGQQPSPAFRFEKTNQILLDVGPKGSFDSCQAKYPSIMKVGDEWWMWYNGRTNDCYTGSIGLAISSDGLKWTKANGGKPIFPHGPRESFDSSKVDHPTVLQFNDRFHMWYTTGDDKSIYTIGYATSRNGVHWTRENDSRPVLTAGKKGAFDDRMVLHPSAVRDGTGMLHLWYNGVGPSGSFRVGHATSRDGVHWDRQNNGKPVLEPSQVGEFKEDYVYNVHVRIGEGKFHMWYSAAAETYGSGGHNCLTYASSENGTHWTKDSVPTLISGPRNSIDFYATFACFTVRREDGLWMYYSAADNKDNYRVSLAKQK
ncbi:MAG: hypothetical protein CMJ64_18500 [Planctomycetaceae bacterium]|nr:hypothetical protein [Planctomycetaceae bacterium]